MISKSMLWVIIGFFILTGCAYTRGRASRMTPGGYKKIAIPIFKNISMDTTLEVAFTNALRNEFQRSHVASIVDKSNSEAYVEGVIDSVNYTSRAPLTKNSSTGSFMPTGTVLTQAYNIVVNTTIRFIRTSDNVLLWSGSFSGERAYNAPLVTLGGVNSVNPLYNLSAQRQNIESMAVDMMEEAHDRLTENF